MKVIEEKLLSDNWYILKRYKFEYKGGLQTREVYDRGNGATIFLYNPETRKVLLTRQFRLPTYLNGNTDGMLIETCAGLLDGDSPEICIQRESEEETGHKVKNLRKIYEAYMSPGAVTETIHFFVGEYDSTLKVSAGGGLASEQEHIEVLEIGFDEVKAWLKEGKIRDAKSIMLIQHALIENLI